MSIPRRQWTAADHRGLVDGQHNRCRCGQEFAPYCKIVYDHIIPLWEGGADTLENMQAMHPHCHDAKTAAEAGPRSKERRIRDEYARHRRIMAGLEVRLNKKQRNRAAAERSRKERFHAITELTEGD